MKLKNLMYSGLILVALTLFGCGGGGSGGGGSDDSVTITKLSKKLVTSESLPSDRKFLGIQGEITLPSGVSVKSDSDNKVLSSYLQPSGVATNSSVIWGSISGNKLTFAMTTTDVSQGIAVGEFATLVCDVASTAPVPLDTFTITGVKIIDKVSGNTVDLSVAPNNLSITIQ